MLASDFVDRVRRRADGLNGRWRRLGLRTRIVAGGVGAGVLVGLLAWAGGARAPVLDALDTPVPVVVGAIERTPTPVFLDGIGTVQPSNTVQVRARVDGEVIEIAFREGDTVKSGDVLMRIDPRPLEANLKQMLANLARDKAQLADARNNLNRLVSIGEFAAKKSVDNQRALVAQYEALVAADEAQVDYARTQLDYTVIRSPIDGRTGLRNVDVGAIVHAADANPLVTVSQITPIAVVFSLNADHLPEIIAGMTDGPLPVAAYAKDNRSLLAEGRLDLVDNQIDQTTGTVKLKASFANDDNRLWPGQFVNARLRVSIYDGLSVPATAIQQGPNGAYLWTIDGDDRAAMRSVVVSRLQDGRALITSSLGAGQKIVLDGQYKLQPGALTEAAAPQPEAPVAGSSQPGT